MRPRQRIIPVFVPHLGCPHDCVFCNQRRISGQQVPATAETVRTVVEEALKTLPAGEQAELAFYGGSFTAIFPREQEQLLQAANRYIQQGVISSIRVSTRPDCIDGNGIERLKKYGVETVELGVQSMCPDVLEASGRGHTAEDAVIASQLIQMSGMRLILQMMTGLPKDTLEKSLYTAQRICALKPDGVRIYPTVVIRDTALYDLWKCGLYREHTVEDAVECCARLTEVFAQASVPIIRMGLNPTRELSEGDAVAGAYHPAFGELVYARRARKKMEKLLRDAKVSPGAKVVLAAARGKISETVGQKRCNVTYLTERFSLGSLKITEQDLLPGEIAVIDI